MSVQVTVTSGVARESPKSFMKLEKKEKKLPPLPPPNFKLMNDT